MKKILILFIIGWCFISCKKISATKNIDSLFTTENIQTNKEQKNRSLVTDITNRKKEIPLYEEFVYFKSCENIKLYNEKYIETYGNLFLIYKESKIDYIYKGYQDGQWIDYPYTAEILEYVEYYYKNNKDYFFLGKITTEGIFDKKNDCIYAWDKFFSDKNINIGFVSEIKEDPFFVRNVLIINGELFAKNPQIQLTIDCDKVSLAVKEIK